MNVKRRVHLVFGLLLIGLMLLPSVNFTSAQESKVLRTAVLPGDFYVDPSLGTWQSEILIINELFTGLTVNNVDTVTPEPGLATEWSASDDGTTYTFKMLDNIPWVRYDPDKGEVVEATDDAGNVRYVTAQDIVYGANRTWDPATASPARPLPAVPGLASGDCPSQGQGACSLKRRCLRHRVVRHSVQ